MRPEQKGDTVNGKVLRCQSHVNNHRRLKILRETRVFVDINQNCSHDNPINYMRTGILFTGLAVNLT